MENLDKLVNELRKLPTETQWLEFKHNNYTPDMIGKDISALANSASLYEKSCAYMLWGIDDEYPYRFSENPDKSAPGAGSRQAHPAESLCGGTA